VEAWIETWCQNVLEYAERVASLVEAWIETRLSLHLTWQASRLPRGGVD